MKHRRIVLLALGVLIFASTAAGINTFVQTSLPKVFGAQVAKVAQSSTTLNLTLYGDPGSARSVFELFQHFSLENLDWQGAIPKPYPPQPGQTSPDGTIDVSLATVLFQKANASHWDLAAQALDLSVNVVDTLDVLVQADSVDGDVDFWESGSLPALNFTFVLTGNVNVSLTSSTISLPGLMQASYAMSSDKFTINVCVIKPMELTLVKPVNDAKVNSTTMIQADLVLAPGLTLNQFRWWADGKEQGGHFEGQLAYNETSGHYEGFWATYQGWNGWYELNVQAQAQQTGGYTHTVGTGIGVRVNNPWVETHVVDQQGNIMGDLQGIPIKVTSPEQQESELKSWCPIDAAWFGWSLTVPGGLGENGPYFSKWLIPEAEWESSSNPLTLDNDVMSRLYDAEGTARKIFCLYTPPQ